MKLYAYPEEFHILGRIDDPEIGGNVDVVAAKFPEIIRTFLVHKAAAPLQLVVIDLLDKVVFYLGRSNSIGPLEFVGDEFGITKRDSD